MTAGTLGRMANEPTGSGVQVPEVSLRIPGDWASPRALSDRLMGTGYTLSLSDQPSDFALAHTATGQRFPMGVVGPDEQIAELFADGGRLSAAELAAVRDHDVKVFVSGPGGSVDAARAVMRAGAAIIRAGGLGVFVDNCGSTHSPTDWLELAGDDADGGVYWALVELTGGPDLMFSTGMHCLGHRDIELPDPPDPGRGMYILHNLLGYSYRSGVTLADGDPIGDEQRPTHVLRHVPCTRFTAGTSFHNPYGVWRLEAVEGD